MPIKMYCDLCEKEVKRNFVHNRWKIHAPITGQNDAVIEIMAGTGGMINHGILCQSCIAEIIASEAFQQDVESCSNE